MRRARSEELVLPVLIAGNKAAKEMRKREGIPPIDMLLLLYIRYNPRVYRFLDLAEGVGVCLETIRVSMQRLRAHGDIEYGRGKVIKMTDSGKRLVRSYSAIYGRIIKGMGA